MDKEPEDIVPEQCMSGCEFEGKPLLVLGQIGAPFGIQGFVHFQSFAKVPDDLLQYKVWYINLGKQRQQWQAFELIEARPHGKNFVGRLSGCTDRDQAAEFRNADIAVLRENLPVLPAGEYYWADLLELSVWTVEGQYLGIVQELLETGSNDVLVVKSEQREHFIPYLPDEVIVSVDLEKREIRVQWDPDF